MFERRTGVRVGEQENQWAKEVPKQGHMEERMIRSTAVL
jgi:hypothetical protein